MLTPVFTAGRSHEKRPLSEASTQRLQLALTGVGKLILSLMRPNTTIIVDATNDMIS